jgi:hypothetical protein
MCLLDYVQAAIFSTIASVLKRGYLMSKLVRWLWLGLVLILLWLVWLVIGDDSRSHWTIFALVCVPLFGAALEELAKLFGRKLGTILYNKINDKHKYTALTMEYLRSNKYKSYSAVVLILIASFCALKLNIEGGTFIALLAIPILLYRFVTYFRVISGYFGLNAEEALELISFLNKNKSTKGPTTPFPSEDEIRDVLNKLARPAVQVQP